jgi:hypothetical protein
MQGDQRNVVCICFGYNVRFGWFLSVLRGPKVLLTCDALWTLVRVAMVAASHLRIDTSSHWRSRKLYLACGLLLHCTADGRRVVVL